MGTTIRSEVSKKNKYWISKHRYYELKHFCLQYPEWNISLSYISFVNSPSNNEIKSTTIVDPTCETAELVRKYTMLKDMVETAATEADPELRNYILIGVTQNKPYDWLEVNRQIPCSKSTYYDRYRKFFYILDKIRE